ncbi:dehydrogenase of unknown specificity, short-chain alcohol dehydrogenase like protein [Rivularia sp. PCC 7116]|uniref:3-oxoacyl-ACP reductase FabG n=1 Tax=Rivularia sp. PCC 7116 TaxID=373994 RepID=UPI00029F2E15|nr:3-oxoacyl-ACP reductase FabG [Rivularia sp. PCC 7116]AFY58069.1 dehydrogenase of unknown specificity, short-chain alcohol dehydrogenase like protein [Rivularia sp. PCC 7116]
MKDKQVLLTGATGGLGVGVTPIVLAQGAFVTIPYRKPEDVENLKQIIPPSDLNRVKFVSADLKSESSVKNIVDSMVKVDVLIHLVGGFSMGKTDEYSFEDWKNDFDLNLNTTFLTCKYCLIKMLQNNYGRIVTIGSRGAVEPVGGLAAYCASKAGVVALTKAIADETKGTNITANSVLPSVIDTEANRKAMGTEDSDKWVKPKSLAEAICFLADETAQDIRGAAIPVYGNI